MTQPDRAAAMAALRSIQIPPGMNNGQALKDWMVAKNASPQDGPVDLLQQAQEFDRLINLLALSQLEVLHFLAVRSG